MQAASKSFEELESGLSCLGGHSHFVFEVFLVRACQAELLQEFRERNAKFLDPKLL